MSCSNIDSAICKLEFLNAFGSVQNRCGNTFDNNDNPNWFSYRSKYKFMEQIATILAVLWKYSPFIEVLSSHFYSIESRNGRQKDSPSQLTATPSELGKFLNSGSINLDLI